MAMIAYKCESLICPGFQSILVGSFRLSLVYENLGFRALGFTVDWCQVYFEFTGVYGCCCYYCNKDSGNEHNSHNLEEMECTHAKLTI